jgi:hypothetical protein
MLESNVFLQKVLSFHARDSAAATTASKGGRQQQQQQKQQQVASDEISYSSGKLSFKWDVGSCSSSSSVAYSPLSLMSAPAKASEQTLLTPLRKDYCMSRLSSMSQQSMLYGGGSPKSLKNMEGEEEAACSCRTAQWITTDSDCELCLHCLFVYVAEHVISTTGTSLLLDLLAVVVLEL